VSDVAPPLFGGAIGLFFLDRALPWMEDRGWIYYRTTRPGRGMTGEAREEFPAQTAASNVYVRDVDGTYAQAIAAGGTAIMEPAHMPYGARSGGVACPATSPWWIAIRVGDVSPEEALRRPQAEIG